LFSKTRPPSVGRAEMMHITLH